MPETDEMFIRVRAGIASFALIVTAACGSPSPQPSSAPAATEPAPTAAPAAPPAPDPVKALVERPMASEVGTGCALQLMWWSGPGPAHDVMPPAPNAKLFRVARLQQDRPRPVAEVVD